MSFEFINECSEKVSEKIGSCAELPPSHMEGIDFNGLERLSDDERVQRIGENWFQNTLQDSPGLLNAFQNLGGKGLSDFGEMYRDYVLAGERMKSEVPEWYEFFKDRVFHGRDFESVKETDKDTFQDITGAEENLNKAAGEKAVEPKQDSKAEDSEPSFTGLRERRELHSGLQDWILLGCRAACKYNHSVTASNSTHS